VQRREAEVANRNYLIGKAEQLTYRVPPPKINPQSEPLYTWEEVLGRITPQLQVVARQQEALSESTAPASLAVTRLTVHPSYIAKSFYPSGFMRELGVVPVGSKPTRVTPDKWTRKSEPTDAPTTEIYVAGSKTSVGSFLKRIESIDPRSTVGRDLSHLWSVDLVSPEEKIKRWEAPFKGYYEVGLSLMPGTEGDLIREAFLSYAADTGFVVDEDMAVSAGNLWFAPSRGPEDGLEALAEFSFLRVLRPVPQLRKLRPLPRSAQITASVELPDAGPISERARVAVLDAGIPDENSIGRWLGTCLKSDAKAIDCPDGPEHGLGVTSAVLFGPLTPHGPAPRPYSFVDNIRVLDQHGASDPPYELYRTLAHIEDVLISGQYEFLNLSLGPDLPIDDDDVHPWTSLIDHYLSSGDVLMTIAVGNNGEGDAVAGLSRVQVPADCVNAMSVGAAAACRVNGWRRAAYSAIGPGRSPGLVKPDVLAFGGYAPDYYHVIAPGTNPEVAPTQGTSFAAPSALRSAVGVRAILGDDISTLAIRALIVHAAQQHVYGSDEVGWGLMPNDLEEIIESPPGTARIVYQGELYPGKYLRVPVPLPDDTLKGNVEISATCCIASPVDPQDTSNYTRAGVGIQWYPDAERGSSEGFFQQRKVATEAELRTDAGKWEAVLHAKKSKRASSLNKPEFQIHYMARDGGAAASAAERVAYAFIVTVKCPRAPELFEKILEAYPETLIEMSPRITLPVRT
jgi:hypothetical protein